MWPPDSLYFTGRDGFVLNLPHRAVWVLIKGINSQSPDSKWHISEVLKAQQRHIGPVVIGMLNNCIALSLSFFVMPLPQFKICAFYEEYRISQL